MITVQYIDDGRYIIGDEDYGYRLCCIDFFDEVTEVLCSEIQETLLEEFKRLLEKEIAARRES